MRPAGGSAGRAPSTCSSTRPRHASATSSTWGSSSRTTSGSRAVIPATGSSTPAAPPPAHASPGRSPRGPSPIPASRSPRGCACAVCGPARASASACSRTPARSPAGRRCSRPAGSRAVGAHDQRPSAVGEGSPPRTRRAPRSPTWSSPVPPHRARRNGSLLLTEALRGAGAVLLDEHGERFIDELAPRDVVARAINDRGSALLDLRQIDRGPVRRPDGTRSRSRATTRRSCRFPSPRRPITPSAAS